MVHLQAGALWAGSPPCPGQWQTQGSWRKPPTVLKKFQLPGETPSIYIWLILQLKNSIKPQGSTSAPLCLAPPNSISHPPNSFTDLFSCLLVLCKQYIYHIYLFSHQLLIALCALYLSGALKKRSVSVWFYKDGKQKCPHILNIILVWKPSHT